jgi:K+-transporting ATPase ATPase C chain
MFKEIKTSIVIMLWLTLLCCGAYPLAVTAIGGTLFKAQAAGSMVGQGSLLIAQPFAKPEYFHPRPSAAGNGYDATSSGGSNFGPLSATLTVQVQGRVAAYRAENGLAATDLVPADAVTASASGLDPHISPKNARLQVNRVAKARNMEAAALQAIVDKHTQGPQWGIFGEPTVNVLELNLALGALPAPPAPAGKPKT